MKSEKEQKAKQNKKKERKVKVVGKSRGWMKRMNINCNMCWSRQSHVRPRMAFMDTREITRINACTHRSRTYVVRLCRTVWRVAYEHFKLHKSLLYLAGLALSLAFYFCIGVDTIRQQTADTTDEDEYPFPPPHHRLKRESKLSVRGSSF